MIIERSLRFIIYLYILRSNYVIFVYTFERVSLLTSLVHKIFVLCFVLLLLYAHYASTGAAARPNATFSKSLLASTSSFSSSLKSMASYRLKIL